MRKIKGYLRSAVESILIVAGLFLVGVPLIITLGVAMILLSVTLVTLDCIKIYEESLKGDSP